MGKKSVLVIRCHSALGAPSVWTEHFPFQGLEHNVEWMLGMVDAAIARALEQAPPEINLVQLNFHLPHDVPRAILASAFYEAATHLNQIVKILPEDAAAMGRNPFAGGYVRKPDHPTGTDHGEQESTGKRRTGKGANHGKT